MAPLSIKESREFVVFQAFSQNKDFRSALKRMEQFDREYPDSKIFAGPEDKKAMRESFRVFKEAEATISRHGTALDYDNPQILERLSTILNNQLPAVSRETLKQATSSAAINKANIGRMMTKHAQNVKKLGNKLMRQKPERDHEQARIVKSGRTGHSPYKEVISTEKTYKPMRDIIWQRMLEEQKQRH